MGINDIEAAITTDMQSTSYTAGQEPWNKTEDAYTIDKQSTVVNNYQVDWDKWHGYYRNVPMYKATIDKLAMWTGGKGFEADAKTKKLLDSIRGFGKDSFNTILFNCIRTYKTCGDSYAEIIRNTAGRLVNVKPLDPGTIKIEANNKGIIKAYVQVSKKRRDGPMAQSSDITSWDPRDIFHLSNGRIADEIHGIPVSEAIQGVIKKWENIMDVMSVVYLRYVKPLLIVKAETDDATEIAAVASDLNKTVKNMENWVVPANVVDMERMSIPQYSTMDPMPWIQMLQSHFIMSTGVPDVILGHSKESAEATAKIIYLAFQQTIEWEQLYIQEQVKNQLGQKIKLVFPASIDPSLLADSRKSGEGNKVNDLDPTNNQKG